MKLGIRAVHESGSGREQNGSFQRLEQESGRSVGRRDVLELTRNGHSTRLDLHRKLRTLRLKASGWIENETARIYRTDQHVGGMASCCAVTAVADVGVAQLK
jgi:hypothetical protein